MIISPQNSSILKKSLTSPNPRSIKSELLQHNHYSKEPEKYALHRKQALE
ncbi:hypothetical protein OBG91_12945 [Lactococcus lactis]|nr:hypothetical protein [Lactococcus lactis]